MFFEAGSLQRLRSESGGRSAQKERQSCSDADTVEPSRQELSPGTRTNPACHDSVLRWTRIPMEPQRAQRSFVVH
jgi:hypothetical protein